MAGAKEWRANQNEIHLLIFNFYHQKLSKIQISMEESSTDSAGFHSSNSFSVPSEPPDIRNWFSSYKYESFVLDTCDDAFGMKARETQNENAGYAADDDAENIRKNDEGDSSEPLKFEEERTFSEVPDSSYSQPVLNEPNHPDNWLSTCVPETCGLDFDDDDNDEEFEIAPREGKVDVFSKEGIKNLEKSNSKSSDLGTPERPSPDELFMNECSPSQEAPDSAYSLSVLHEPHHPDNWLSTCISETCGFDLEEHDISRAKKDALAKEGIDKGNSFENSNCKISSDFGTLEKPSSDEIVNEEERPSQKENLVPYSQVSILSEPPDIKNWFSSYAYESPVSDEETNNGGVLDSVSQHAENNSFIDQEPKEDGQMKSHTIVKEPSTELTPDERSASSSKAAAGSTEPFTISGFVTTRKNKTTKRLNNDENSCPGSRQHVGAKCLKTARLVSSSRNRNVLSERTNVVLQQQLEVTGKWKCPQRNKPVMGPPLKQLRLERWVTKL